MSSDIDSKVVEMRFDNSQFERNVQTSLSTLANLKSGLNFSGVGAGIQNAMSAVKGFSLDPMISAANEVQVKFSAMQMFMHGIFNNIANDVYQLGKRIVNELAINPVTTGFDEYELKLNSVQTIMAGSGESLNTVNKYLNELNKYADDTIYSFSDMTQNIGKFTNAGVSLDKSVAAIKGVANVAALSGANANEASRAMYNFAQAISSGYVKLIDWKSIELANMGTKEFKNELIKTAVAMGTVTEAADGMYQAGEKTFNATSNFNDVLKEEWLTSEVLIETLNRYSDSMTDVGKRATAAAQDVKTMSQLFDTLKESAQSGWAETWEHITGDFYEAKKLFTEVSNAVGGLLDRINKARNDFLGGVLDSNWKLFSNNAAEMGISVEDFGKLFKQNLVRNGVMTQEMVDGFESIEDLLRSDQINVNTLTTEYAMYVEAIANANDEMLKQDGYTDEQIKAIRKLAKDIRNTNNEQVKLLRGLSEMSGREKIIDSIRKSIQLLGKIISPIKEAFIDIFPPITIERAKSLISSIHNFISSFSLSSKSIANIKKIFLGLFSVLDIVRMGFVSLARPVIKILTKLASTIGGLGIGDKLAAIGVQIKAFRDRLKTNGFFETISEEFYKGAVALKNNIAKIDWNNVYASFENGLKNLYQYTKTIPSRIKPFILNIKDQIKILFEKISNSDFDFRTLGETIVSKIKALKDYVHFPSRDAFLSIGKSFGEYIRNIFGYLKNFFSENVDIKSIGESIAKTFFEIKKVIASKFKNAFSGLSSIEFDFSWVSEIKNFITNGLESLRGAFNFDGLKNIGEAIRTGIQNVIDFLGFTDLKTVLQLANLGFLAKIRKEFASFIGNLGDAVKNFGDSQLFSVPGGIIETLDSVRTSLEAYQNSLKSDILVKIAIAVGVLAASLFVLSKIDKDKAGSSLGILTILLTEVIAAMKYLSKASGMNINAVKSLVLLLGIGALLKIFASIIKDLSAYKWEDMFKGISGIGLMLAEIAGFTLLLKKINLGDNKVLKSGIGMLAIVSAMKLMASVIQNLAEYRWEDLGRGVVGMSVVLATIAGFTWAMKKIKANGNSSDIIKMGIGLTIMAASLKIFASVIKDFSNFDIGALIKGLLGMAALLLTITVLSNQMKGNNIATGIGLVVIAASLYLLAGALFLIGSIPLEVIGKGLLAMAGAFLVIGLFCKVIGTSILPVAFGFLMLSSSVMVLGIGLVAVAAGLTSLAIGLTSIAVTGPLIVKGFLDTISGLVTGLITLIPGIAKNIVLFFTSMATELANNSNALGEALSNLLKNALDWVKENSGNIFRSFFENIDQMLNIANEYAPKIVDKFITLIISVLNTLTTRIPELIPAIKNFLNSLFTTISIEFSNLDYSTLIDGALLFGIIGGLMWVFSTIAPLVPAAMTGVLGAAGVISEIAILIAAIGTINQISGFGWLVSEGGELLEKIGEAIGKFVGGFIGGALEGITGALPAMATDLSMFMINLTPFIMGANMISPESMSGVKALAEMILLLTAAELISGLASWLTGGSSIVDFGKDLAEFGPYMKKYADSVKGLDGEAVESSANAGKMLAEMANALPKDGGWADAILGQTKSLKTFGEELAFFGPEIKKYGESIKGLDGQTVEASANAGKMLAEMANTLPKDGGWADAILGQTKSLETFGKELATFGPEIKKYGDSVKGLDGEAVESSANAGKMLAEMANTLPKEGGWWSKISGGAQSLSNFADDLVAFGPKIKEYADSVFGLDSDAVSNSTNAALILTDLATVVSEIDSGGWSLVGNNSPLVKFGDSIKTFGTKLSEFYQNTSNINTNILSAVIGQVNRLITTAKNMVGMDTVVVADFGKALKDLGESGISGFIEAFELSADRVKQTAEDMLTTFLDGLDSKKLDTTLYFSNLISDILDELGNQYESFKDAGRDLVQGFADGISENIYIAENKAGEMAQAAYRSARTALKIHSPSRLFMKLGSYIPKGMAKGISNESGIVSKTVDGMVSESVKMTTQTIAKILDLINSGVESEPVIRPVLDLSNVRTGVGEVNALFSKTQAARIGYDFAGYPRVFPDSAFEPKQGNTMNTSTFGDINIYVNGSDLSAEEIAEKIGAKVHQIARARGRI